MSKRMPGCNQAVKQGDSKNGERENSERTFSVSARNPQGCTRSPGPWASKRRIGKDVKGGVSGREYA